MKFNYEFGFNVDSFANWLEEDFYDIVDDNAGDFNKGFDESWIKDRLYNWCSDEDCPRDLILQYDMDNQTKRYYPQIIEEAYEILKKKYKEMKEKEKEKKAEELKVHLRAIKEYCENRIGEAQSNNCKYCPLYDYCGRFINGWEL